MTKAKYGSDSIWMTACATCGSLCGSRYDFFSAHMDIDEFLARIVKEGVVDLCLPEPGVARMLDQLQGQGVKSSVVTARGYLPHAQAATQA